jgi:hypothetical protein
LTPAQKLIVSPNSTAPASVVRFGWAMSPTAVGDGVAARTVAYFSSPAPRSVVEKSEEMAET